MPAEGSIIDVSPDVPGFNMRPAGGGVQPTEITQPLPSNYVSFNDPFLGAPIAFAQCHNTPGMDTPTTVPIYNIPKDGNIGFNQSAVPTVFTSGVSSDSIPWSTAENIIRDIVREGPFDAGEDSPLISTGMPGCPYRMTSYTGTNMVDADTASPSPVSGVHRSSGVGKIIEPFTIVLGDQIGSGMCYGVSSEPAERCGFHVESSNSGTIRNVVA